MKRFFQIAVVYYLLIYNAFAQEASLLRIEGTAAYDCAMLAGYNTIIVEPDAEFRPGACNINTGELIVYGKLLSGSGKITCETLTIDGGEWQSLNAETITIHSDFIAKNATIGGIMPTFSVAGNTVFNGNVTLYDCQLAIEGNMEVNGVVEIQSRTGIKKIKGDVLISGVLNNSANENIEISGNLNCIGTIADGNFTLLGENKGLYGNILANRLEVEGSYTNYGTVEIKNSSPERIPAFTGNGTFIQAENALLTTRAPSSPELIASAKGNTVRYVRNAAITINCAEFYNVECSTTYNLTQNFPTFSLAQNTIIYGSLQFTQECFLDLQDYSLIFPKWTEQSLLYEHLDIGGIIPGNGMIKIDGVEPNCTVHIPLYHSSEFSDFAHVKLTNHDVETTNFWLTRLHNYITDTSTADGTNLDDSPYISVMYEIASQSENSTISFYWHNQKEVSSFDRNNCRVVFFNEDKWEAFGEKAQAQQSAHDDIYYVSTNYRKNNTNSFIFGIKSETFFPVCLAYFTVTPQQYYNMVTWKTMSEHDCDYFMLLKSVDGVNFSSCARIAGNGSSSFAHTYSFCDKELQRVVTYYQLAQYNYDNTVWKSNIIAALPHENYVPAMLLRKDNRQFVVQTLNSENCFVSDNSGRIVATFVSNTPYDFSNFTQGVYYIYAERSKIFDNCLVVR